MDQPITEVASSFTREHRLSPERPIQTLAEDQLGRKEFAAEVARRYPMEEGAIEVDSIEPVGLPDITPELARASGFLGVLDLLKVAKHGRGNNVYLIRFHYIPPGQKSAKRAAGRK